GEAVSGKTAFRGSAMAAVGGGKPPVRVRWRKPRRSGGPEPGRFSGEMARSAAARPTAPCVPCPPGRAARIPSRRSGGDRRPPRREIPFRPRGPTRMRYARPSLIGAVAVSIGFATATTPRSTGDGALAPPTGRPGRRGEGAERTVPASPTGRGNRGSALLRVLFPVAGNADRGSRRRRLPPAGGRAPTEPIRTRAPRRRAARSPCAPAGPAGRSPSTACRAGGDPPRTAARPASNGRTSPAGPGRAPAPHRHRGPPPGAAGSVPPPRRGLQAAGRFALRGGPD